VEGREDLPRNVRVERIGLGRKKPDRVNEKRAILFAELPD
jgi:hypothetical protein